MISHEAEWFGEFEPAKGERARQRMRRVGGPVFGSRRWKEIQQNLKDEREFSESRGCESHGGTFICGVET